MADLDYPAIEAEVFRLINECRSNPSGMLQDIQNRLSSFEGNLFSAGGMKFESVEGEKAVEECLEYMIAFSSVDELIRIPALDSAAKSLGTFLFEHGGLDHIGKDGENLIQRVEKLGQWRGELGEILASQYYNASDFMLHWLVCDGIDKRSDRLHILKKDYTSAGVFVGKHKEYGTCAVVIFSSKFIPNGEEEDLSTIADSDLGEIPDEIKYL